MRSVLPSLALLLAACGESQPPPPGNGDVRTEAGNVAAAEPAPAPAPAEQPTASASAEEAAEPAPDLPLRKGVYVAVGADCRSPSSPDFKVWDGKGLTSATTRQCVLSGVARQSRGVMVEQTCIDTYSGKPASARFTMTIPDDRHFSTLGTSNDQSYRLCPADQVPDWLKTPASANR